MAKFLNTPKLNHWIPKLIQESNKELIIVAPYIKLSNSIYNALQVASNKGVNIFLIYRENKLTTTERDKLNSIKNINLLHHPNVHCKCFFNGSMLIIGSMNLYEYSQENNREMGVLVCDVREIDQLEGYDLDGVFEDDDFFANAIEELRDIVNGSSLEVLSTKVKEVGFEIDIIKTLEEKEIERCKRINKTFLNKKFQPIEDDQGNWASICRNYFDNIDVIIDYRTEIHFKISSNELKKLHKIWEESYNEFEYKGFKYYWNNTKQPFYLYEDSKFDWVSLTRTQKAKKYKNTLDLIISKYRIITGK